MARPVAPPTLDHNTAELVDWLELTAFFDEYGVAHIQALLGSLLEQQETADDNFGIRDQQKEELIENLENEVKLRQDSLGEAYPFFLGSDGGQLVRDQNWRDGRFTFYLICLVATHITGSAILHSLPVNELLLRLRNRVFQTVATFGMAGLAQGPAFSVGWPRQSGETIVQLLERASAAGGGFSVRIPHGKYTSPQEKDGGVDVIAWTPGGLPPPTTFWFAQTASGRNWPSKPVADHARVFRTAYMNDHMSGNVSYVTLIPFRVLDDKFWNSQHLNHYSILDRLRLPYRALKGSQLAERNTIVDGVGQLSDLTQWLCDIIKYYVAA